MENLLNRLKLQIEDLERQVKQTNWNSDHHVIFDEQLFYTPQKTHDGSFYLQEIKQTYQIVLSCSRQNQFEKATFFAEQLVNQISALSRELSTHHLRATEPQITYETLTEKHSRHLDYLRRLNEMKYELGDSADATSYRKIAALDNRIYRCEQMIKQIEKEMEKNA